MIFNYFINEDINDLNNSIILCLDNEIESSILEKYYENTFKRIYKEETSVKLDNNKKDMIIENNNNLIVFFIFFPPLFSLVVYYTLFFEKVKLKELIRSFFMINL